MTVSAIESGITGAIPALNYRTVEELRAAIREIRTRVAMRSYRISLIVQVLIVALIALSPVPFILATSIVFRKYRKILSIKI